jgi:arabinose-5-phosphate isomerase
LINAALTLSGAKAQEDLMIQSEPRDQLSGDEPLRIIEIGREVVTIEAGALVQMAGALDGHFAEAVAMLARTRQRVIVSGMGKSGHVGRKIAATLASTGTPAMFVHPAEASHGDLGMIIEGDLLLILSNSGSTAELKAVIQHAKRVGCSIIAIASQHSSHLMQSADVPLLLPKVREACPVNIAPTTSTTLMLALGDALAVATMRIRGLTRDRLRLFHPGGSIGGRLARVDTLMRAGKDLPLVSPEMPMADVVIEMSVKGFGIAGVVADGRLIGAITDGDLRRHSADLFAHKAGEVMTRSPRVVSQGTLCEDALLLLEEHRITALFVVAEEQPDRVVGLLQIHDLTRACHG